MSDSETFPFSKTGIKDTGTASVPISLTVVYTSSSKDLPFNRERLLLAMTFPAESINITKPESALISCSVMRREVFASKCELFFAEENIENSVSSRSSCIFVFIQFILNFVNYRH